MRSVLAAAAVCVFAATTARAECPADVLGTARTISIDPSQYTQVGLMQYPQTVPLADKEVVLTFDDGPLPPNTNRVLDILAAECVKATFFIVGRQAQEFPGLVRRAYDEGHTIATHTQDHPLRIDRLPIDRAAEEIEDGIASTAAALGDGRMPAPFFRVPGLRRSAAVEQYLAAHNITVWSADFVADDWRHISAKQVLKRALDRIERKGKGVLLLHDIHRNTAAALPELLKELKARGYRIVHVVPIEQAPAITAAPAVSPAAPAATPTAPTAPTAAPAATPTAPAVSTAAPAATPTAPAVSPAAPAATPTAPAVSTAAPAAITAAPAEVSASSKGTEARAAATPSQVSEPATQRLELPQRLPPRSELPLPNSAETEATSTSVALP